MSSSVPSSPTAPISESDFDMDIDVDTGASTAVPSSPAPSVDEDLKHRATILDAVRDHSPGCPDALKALELEQQDVAGKDGLQARLRRLDLLLEKSSVYTALLGERMKQTRQIRNQAQGTAVSSVPQPEKPKGKKGRGRKSESVRDSTDTSKAQPGSKRGRNTAVEGADEEVGAITKRLKLDDEAATKHEDQESDPNFKQPQAVTGAKLKDYQLVGVQWLTSLWVNGVNGILADEMGLGKTLQTIAFLAHIREVGILKPALIVCPLSVLHNWADEFEKFAPSIPVCMYHGTPAKRAEIRRTRMKRSEDHVSPKKAASHTNKSDGQTNPAVKTAKKRSARPARRTTRSSKGEDLTGKAEHSQRSSRCSSHIKTQRSLRQSARHHQRNDTGATSTDEGHEDQVALESESDDVPDGVDDDASEGDEQETDDASKNDAAEKGANEDEAHNLVQPQQARDTFPIVLTTYEMIIKDRQHLAKYEWNFIVVDEGHRLKNMDCKLMQEIKKYDSANRLILTGTPLHNNLAELWSLLNFILPDIFTDLDSFQEWFNLPTLQSSLPNGQSNHVVSKLHGILKPFLLRRLKADVEYSLPPKKEYVLYAPLSERQREVYDAVLTGVLRGYLINGKQNENNRKDEAKQLDNGRQMRKRRKVTYRVDGDDDEWFDRLEGGEFGAQPAHEEELDAGRRFHYKNTVKQVNSMKLQNTVMQLRKVCSHPFLFDWPSDPVTREPIVNEQLVNASGKMMVLDRLLGELFNRGHKVLLFSQFTTMLDIIEEWAHSFKSWPTCRIDGSTGPLERRDEMNRFQKGGDDHEAPRLFLLSTRAGGLGINLTAADTVIFYDQDWNPQMDIQAQDRAHRIGQTKPVLIFRLVSAHTVETKIMQRANEKRQLEALVIAKGKFRMPGSASRAKGESIAETAASLLKLEGEKIEVIPSSEAGKVKVISDSDLEKLLDRSPEVFAGRRKGWTSGAKAGEGEQAEQGDVAFEVFQAPADQCNDSLAAMMGEKIV